MRHVNIFESFSTYAQAQAVEWMEGFRSLYDLDTWEK
jgi:hypothetical protein